MTEREGLDQTVEKDICIDCGTGIDKPKPVQVAPHFFAQPLSLCPRCDDAWRWRGQICKPRPYQLPLWRPKKLMSDDARGIPG